MVWGVEGRHSKFKADMSLEKLVDKHRPQRREKEKGDQGEQEQAAGGQEAVEQRGARPREEARPAGFPVAIGRDAPSVVAGKFWRHFVWNT